MLLADVMAESESNRELLVLAKGSPTHDLTITIIINSEVAPNQSSRNLVAGCIRLKTLVLVYRDVNGSSPVYIQNMVKPYDPARLLRFASSNGLAASSLQASHPKNWVV
ncbi:unnamed protein product [Pleuronectes platessa]|uniref:Uncharacterized protein n=1 Tax=Pleuronectes platessa TaxID=8262 RepID=A0A9N7W0S4_PLEPL|nr:unnamed protein product [Pleuronectes platessa]